MESFLGVLFIIGGALALVPSDNCMHCICGGSSNQQNATEGCGEVVGGGICPPGCLWDTNSCSCGPYQIHEPYFIDCSEFHEVPINNWVLCANNMECAEICVLNYMDRYGTYCTRKPDSFITCEEYAGIHKGGPGGCDADWTQDFRDLITDCCDELGGCNN